MKTGKKVKYTGVSLRSVFADVVPEYKIQSMPEWKELARQILVVEVTGAGDRFLLAGYAPRWKANQERRAVGLQNG